MAQVLRAADRAGKGGVLLVTSSFPRWVGDSTTPFILHIAQDLIAEGWDVKVLAPHAPGAQLQEVLEGVPVRRFRYFWPLSQQTLCYQGGALANLQRNPLNSLKLVPFVLCELTAILHELASRRFTVLHSHWLLPQGFTAGVAGRLTGIPHVATVHGSDVFALQGGLLSGFKRIAARLSSLITVNSSATEAAVRRIAPQAAKVVRIPIGAAEVDESVLRRCASVRERFRVGQGPLVSFVGRLVEQKGLEDLLRAIALLVERFADLRALIVGDGPQRVQLEALADSLRIANRVTFAGWLPSSDVPSYMAASDMLVVPSRRDRDGAVEAQGLVLIEAMLAGTPVIATRLGGVLDVVQHEQTGLLVDERAPEQIAAAIARLADAPAFVRALCERGRQLARAGYTRAGTAQAFSHSFATVLNREERAEAGSR